MTTCHLVTRLYATLDGEIYLHHFQNAGRQIITAGDFAAGENDYLFVSDGNRVRLRLLAYSGASARPIRFNFIAYNYAGEWSGTTDLTLSTGAKHVVAFSYEAGVRKQVYIDGSLSTVTGETDTSPVVELTNAITLGADGAHTDFSEKFRFSSFWLKSGTSDDLSTALGNYVSGTTPLDNANGAQVYMKMDNLTSDGSTPTEWTDAGSPLQEDY